MAPSAIEPSDERGPWTSTEDRTPQGVHLHGAERAATLLGGGLLVHWGLRHGGLLGLAGTLAGGAIAWMGVNGARPAPEAGDMPRRPASPTSPRSDLMTAKMPPVPTENRSAKGPGDKTRAPKDTTRDEGAPDNLDEEGRFGNIKQNTTNQGYQQDR